MVMEHGEGIPADHAAAHDADMLDEYDFSDGVRGKYADRYAAGNNVVALAPDVAEAFPDSQAVNEALRTRTAAVFRRAGNSLEAVATLTAGDTLTSPLLPGFTLPAEHLWRLARG